MPTLEDVGTKKSPSAAQTHLNQTTTPTAIASHNASVTQLRIRAGHAPKVRQTFATSRFSTAFARRASGPES